MAKETTRVDAKGQIELNIPDTPIYIASEDLIKAKARVGGAKEALEVAEKAWIEVMKDINKSKINHKGDIIQYVKGKTSDDHARFCKA